MRRPYNINNSFVDILFNVLIGFFMLLLIALCLIKPEINKKEIELKAEYMITLEWPNDSKDDVDLLVKTPMKQFVYYGNRDVKSASLDRDDRGALNDTMTLEDGTVIEIKENWEHITLRKTLKGEYVVNAMMFNKLDKTETEAKIKIEKLNPYKLIYSNTLKFNKSREEQTVLRFTVDSNGNVTSRSTVPYSIQNKVRIRSDR